jgi:phage-related protein
VRLAFLLRKLQQGELLEMPHCRQMPSIGQRVSELRIRDHEKKTAWRIICRVDPDMVIDVEAFEKKTQRTPQRVIETCKQRLANLDRP